MYRGTALVAEGLFHLKKQEYNPKSTVICFIAVTVTFIITLADMKLQRITALTISKLLDKHLLKTMTKLLKLILMC